MPGVQDERINRASWRRAWARGFQVALHHRVLLLLVAVAVLCERALTLSALFHPAPGSLPVASGGSASGSSMADMAAALSRMTNASAPTGSQAADVVADLPWTLFPAAGLLVAGMLLLIGVATLLRDLLLHHAYRSQRVLSQGSRFFWPVLRYKLPIYLVGSVFSLLVVASLADAWRRPIPQALVPSVGLGLLWLIGFGIARVFLSLGTKIIVTEAAMPMASVYRRVWRIVQRDLGVVIVFYALLLGLTACTTVGVWGLSMLPAPPALRLVAAIALLAVVTLIMKAASFDLYLQLAGRPAAASTHAL